MKYLGELNLNQTSETLKVEVEVLAEHLELVSSKDERPLCWDFYQLSTQAPFKGAPLIIYHSDGSRLLIDDYDQVLFSKLSAKKSQLLYLFETNKRIILASSIGLVAFILLFYVYILPAASSFAAQKMTYSQKKKIEEVLIKRVLKEDSFAASKLSLEKQKEIRAYLLKHTPEAFSDVNILFRSTPSEMANAFALSHRTIIFTDKVIEILKVKNELLAVYFHELGHLEKEHVLKRTIRATSLAILANLIIGDLTGGTETLATISATVIGLSFDRKLELEADQLGLEKLLKYSVSPKCFPKALEKIEAYFKKKLKISMSESNWTKYFSTHPNNKERSEIFLSQKPPQACDKTAWETEEKTTH